MTSLLLAFAFVTSAPIADPLAVGRRALQALDYEGAVSALIVVAVDETIDDATRARAHMLIAEARFGIAGEAAAGDVEGALRTALALDPRIDFENRDDVSPRLVALLDALRPKPASSRRAEPARPPEVVTVSVDESSASSWWIVSAALGATTLIAGGIAGVIELSLVDPLPLQSADAIRGTQRAGAAAVVIAAASGLAAVGATAFALSTE